MKDLVYLYGAPASGKSTTSASLYTAGKRMGLSCGLVTEVVSGYIERGEPLPADDVIMSEQIALERQKLKANDFVVSDSPPVVACHYASSKISKLRLIIQMNKHIDSLRKRDIKVHVFFLTRIAPYSTKNRLHTEAESDIVSKGLMSDLITHSPYPITVVPDTIPDEFRTAYLMSKIGLFK